MIRLFTCLLACLLACPLAAQKTAKEYEKMYISNFYEALDYMKTHKAVFMQELGKDAGDVRAIAAIAFPEMVRFSELSNAFETLSIEKLYVKFGAKYADFSISIFQMKPSFIERLEKYLKDNWLTVYKDVWEYDATDETEIRQKRVARMKNLRWQLRYLRAFYGAVLHRFPQHFVQNEDKIRFLAAAYNRGFMQSEEEILRWKKQYAFPHGTRYTGKQYNYAEIAYYFYSQHSSGIF